MHPIKKGFSKLTGYWIHKISTLPVGADLFVDIHKRINYGQLNTMFDVGANTGQTWEWFRNNEPKSKIYCFEPVAGSFKELVKNVGHDKHCITNNLALADTVGEKTIRLFDDQSVLNSLKNELMNQNDNAVIETITIDTLDNYCHQNKISKIDFLKIDTEGYELNVLKGGLEMLKKGNVSFIYCETGMLKRNKRNTNFAELTEWLADNDYYFFGLYQLISDFWKSGNYFGNALYIHKAIFNK